MYLYAGCRYFQMTGRRVSFEYTLLSGVNDQHQHAAQLASLLRSHDMCSHVNLIPWNPVDESEFQRPSRNRVTAFKEVRRDVYLWGTVIMYVFGGLL